MRYVTLALLLAAVSTQAAQPATRPRDIAPVDPPGERWLGQVIDVCEPAFVPKFAQVSNPPAGNFAEREWARINTYPSPVYVWPRYFGFPCHGYVPPPSNVFIR